MCLVRVSSFAISVTTFVLCASCGAGNWVPESLHVKPDTVAPFEACYRVSIFGEKKIPTRMKFGVTVSGTGRPSWVGIVQAAPRDLELETCVIDYLLQGEYGFRFAGRCYIGTLELDERVSMSVEQSKVAWCKHPYVFPPEGGDTAASSVSSTARN